MVQYPQATLVSPLLPGPGLWLVVGQFRRFAALLLLVFVGHVHGLGPVEWIFWASWVMIRAGRLGPIRKMGM